MMTSKKNPTQTEWTEIAGGAAATLASLFWSPRAGGLIGGATAVYSAFQGHKQRAAVVGALSGLVFFSPELREAFGTGEKGLGKLVSKPVVE